MNCVSFLILCYGYEEFLLVANPDQEEGNGVVSFTAVFWDVTQRFSWERCVISRKTAAKETRNGAARKFSFYNFYTEVQGDM